MLEKKDTQNETDQKSTEKNKKMEKPPSDPHREYLDMDTDEEEFGKPETPEPEEEPPPEPEKPIFSSEELEQLVSYVKDFTVLPALDEADWNEECYKTISEFFCDPSKILLAIFYDTEVLKACLDFPSNAIEGLTYFLRSPWQIYTPDNFHSTIIFGSITGNVENSVLKVMENVYALGIFNSRDWPSALVKRNEIFANTHSLLTKLTDTTYKLMGLTVLYVPKEGTDLDLCTIPKAEEGDRFVLVATDEASHIEMLEDQEEKNDEAKDEGELLGRLETVANFWIRQIREAIAEQNPCGNLAKIKDKLEFWNYRYDNLRGLLCQLKNRRVLRIIEKLENVKLTSIRRFYDLTKSVEKAIEEALSNIDYLSLLTDPCDALEIPEIKEEQVSEILYLISFIWLESPFYNSKARTETLCEALSTQIVSACKESIDLDTIFQGDTINGKGKLRICINCCEKYKTIYDEHVDAINEYSKNRMNWEVDKENVFNHVDAFVRRCQDVMEICNTIVVFGKSSKSVSFGGSNGASYESACTKIEISFYDSLQAIKNVKEKILDVTEATWIEHVSLFRSQILELEVMVGNLINDIFDNTNCIEESIEALYTLQRYNERESINELLHLKWVNIWKIFDNEIRLSKQAIIEHSEDYHSSAPYYSGRASMLRLRQSRLTRYQIILVNASDWLGDCEAQIPVLKNYKKLMSAIVNEEKLLFEAWQRLIGDEKRLTSVLSKPVLRRGKSRLGPIETDMDYHLLDTLEEAQVWISLSYEVRPLLKKLSTKWLTLKLRYEGAVLLCRSYNAILKVLSTEERLLFKELLKSLDNSVAPGLDKITWNSPDVEKFYTDCTVDISNLQEFIALYEKANLRIQELFEEISDVRLFEISDNTIFQIRYFLIDIEKQCAEEMCKIRLRYENILTLLTGIREGFEMDFEEVIQNWSDFIQAKDRLLEDSLCSAVTNSLQSIMKLIKGDEMSTQKTLFILTVDFSDNQLIICEDLGRIEEVFKNISKLIMNTLKPLKWFSEKLQVAIFEDGGQELWDSIEQRESCRNLQEDINSEINELIESITEFINSVDCINEISSIDVTKTIEYYASNEPNREVLEADITRCTKLADSIETLENKVPIKFVILDMREAKLKMIEKCESWRETLFIELSKVIVAEQKSDAGTPTPVEELSLCGSYGGSDDSAA